MVKTMQETSSLNEKNLTHTWIWTWSIELGFHYGGNSLFCVVNDQYYLLDR